MEATESSAMQQGLREFEAALGDFVMTWNYTETMIRQLLISLCGHYPTTYILTAELNPFGLTRAIESIAKDMRSGPFNAPILHVVEFYNRLREYRNYYVHGIYAMEFADDRAFGLVDMVSAKGRLATTTDKITRDRLQATKEQMMALMNLLLVLGFHMEGVTPADGQPVPPLPPLPEMPPLPDRFQKPRQYPLGVQRESESSPASPQSP